MIRRAIDRGEIRDQAEAATRLGVTRARITQILDLTLFAPDLQETVLGLANIEVTELTSVSSLRAAAHTELWTDQRVLCNPGIPKAR